MSSITMPRRWCGRLRWSSVWGGGIAQGAWVRFEVGEGQLVTFARVMAHDPTVVIMDEATASIDSLTEGESKRP